MQPEKQVKDHIKREMYKQFPDAWNYMPVQTGFGQHGIPDHIFCVPVKITPEMLGSTIGVFVAIEAKTDTGKLSKFQGVQIDRIKRACGIVDVIYGTDQVDEKVRNIRECLR